MRPRKQMKKMPTQTDDFWSSLEGVLSRVLMVAASYIFSVYNYVAQASSPSGFVEWVTAQDADVCPICEGNAGTYDLETERVPEIPVHPSCRCILEPVG